MSWFDSKPKYALIAHVTEQGLIKLVNDLNDLYDKHRGWCDNIELRIRKSKDFGPYQVNILNTDFQEMITRHTESEFIELYQSVGDE